MKPFDDNQAFFVDVTLESILWGVYTCIFVIYLQLERRERRNALRYPLCVLWILCTSFFAIDATSAYLWIFGDNTHDSNVYNTFNVVSSVLYSVADYVSQSILIYRCWVMWNKRWYVIALPLLASFTSLAGSITLIGSLATLGRGPGAQPDWFFKLGTASFAISLATNALVTATLVARLWLIYREIKSSMPAGTHGGHDLRPAMSMLIESGMITFIGQLIWVVLFTIQNLGFNAVAGPITQLYGITPTIVIVRVAMGSSYETNKTRMESSMQFGSTSGAATSHASPDDDCNPTASLIKAKGSLYSLDNSRASSSKSTLHEITPTRHPDFWLYDGSIVLSVDNVLFRVHQTILANHSEVFADLFTVPQPPPVAFDDDGNELGLIDGCPVVELQDDDASDFADLLRAIYHPSHFDQLAPDVDLESVLTFVSGILKLSSKYLIRYLRQKCIAILIAKLPATFDDYLHKAALTNPDRYRSDTVMRAIRLAQQTNVLEVLPYAFYCVARFPQKRLLKDRPGDISWKDKTTCLVGRERLHWAQMSLSHSFLLVFQRAPDCSNQLCAHARGPHAEWHALENLNLRSPHPLRAYERWDSMNVCKECVTHCKSRHEEGRKEVWRCLPGLFELPAWEELRRIQNV